MIASFILLHPKFTFRALFELFPFHKIDEFFVILTDSIGNLILFTAHSFMPINSTIQAILLFTL